MGDVSINIEARDRVSQTLDSITRSVERLTDAMNRTGSASINTGSAMGNAFDGTNKKLMTLGRGFQTVGGAMTKYITKPAIGAAVGLAGLTLTKGFARMKDMDEARAKMAAMGIEGQKYQKIYESANASVKETAFALNEAMTTAASASAAGVKGNEMQDYLTAVSNTAAVAGTSFQDMGMVFNKVAANGKVTAEEWNMMTDRSVDISGALQKQLGVNREELLKMRQAGEITSEDFVAAMGSMYDGAAQEIGSSTISGAISNINAAISRIGANFLGDTEDANSFANKILPLLNSVKGALGKVEEGATKIGEKFADLAGPYMDKMTNFFNGIADGSVKIDGAKAKMAAIAGIAGTLLGPALTVAGKGMMFFATHGKEMKAIGGVLKKIAPQALRIAGPVALIGTALISAWKNSESFRTAVSGLFSTLWDSLQQVAAAIAPVFNSLLSILGPVMGAIGDLLAPLVTVLASVIAGVATKIAAIAGLIAPVMAKIASAAGKASAKIRAMGGAWKAIKSGTKSLLTKVSNAAAGILTSIKEAWDKIKTATKSLLTKVSNGAAGVLNGIKGAWDSIKSGTKTLTTKITKIYETITRGGKGKGKGKGRSATGTKSAEGGWTLVGERGPEMVNLPKGASVHTARETERAFGAAASGSGAAVAPQLTPNKTVNFTVNMTNNLAEEGMSVDQIISVLVSKLEEVAAASAEGMV